MIRVFDAAGVKRVHKADFWVETESGALHLRNELTFTFRGSTETIVHFDTVVVYGPGQWRLAEKVSEE